ncbi:hypothetical protein RQP46_011322 [Phenoliferia psychrophenolica]
MRTATNYGLEAKLALLPPELIGCVVNIGAVTTVCQSTFAWRLWTIGRGKGMKHQQYTTVFPVAIAVLTTLQFGLAIWLACIFAGIEDLINAIDAFPRSYGWLACSLLADIMIAAGMTWHLVIMPRRLGLGESANKALGNIALRALETNGATLITVSALTITVVKANKTLWWLFCANFMIFAHIISLIVSLTSRTSVGENADVHPMLVSAGVFVSVTTQTRVEEQDPHAAVRGGKRLHGGVRGAMPAMPIDIQLESPRLCLPSAIVLILLSQNSMSHHPYNPSHEDEKSHVV